MLRLYHHEAFQQVFFKTKMSSKLLGVWLGEEFWLIRMVVMTPPSMFGKIISLWKIVRILLIWSHAYYYFLLLCIRWKDSLALCKAEHWSLQVSPYVINVFQHKFKLLVIQFESYICLLYQRVPLDCLESSRKEDFCFFLWCLRKFSISGTGSLISLILGAGVFLQWYFVIVWRTVIWHSSKQDKTKKN